MDLKNCTKMWHEVTHLRTLEYLIMNSGKNKFSLNTTHSVIESNVIVDQFQLRHVPYSNAKKVPCCAWRSCSPMQQMTQRGLACDTIGSRIRQFGLHDAGRVVLPKLGTHYSTCIDVACVTLTTCASNADMTSRKMGLWERDKGRSSLSSFLHAYNLRWQVEKGLKTHVRLSNYTK